MIKYEYDAVAVGSWRQKGSGIATFLEELNSRGADGWKLKTIFLHESDSYVMLERELADKPDPKAEEVADAPTS
jgi:hypothetical protein